MRKIWLTGLVLGMLLPGMGMAAAQNTPAHAEAQIVILGEVHDNAHAHKGQAEALRDLNAAAVVFEMLSPEDATRADMDRALIPEIWADSRWPDFALYAPIFEALGDARIVGAASPRSVAFQVFEQGPASVFGADAAAFGLADALPEAEQTAREALQFRAHCEAMPEEMMSGMVAVQRFRDAVFARAALAALEAHGPPVAIITGNGHARTDWGIPAVIARAAPEVTVWAKGFVEQEPDAPYDAVQIVPPAEREDPCKALRARQK